MLKGLAFLCKTFIALFAIVLLIGLLAGPGLREQEKRDARDDRPAKHRVHDGERGR